MLVLLTASGNLEKVTQMLGYSPDQVRRLDAAIHQVRGSKKFRDVYGEAVLQQIAPVIEQIPAASAPDDLDLLDALHSIVDEGEAQLMALAAPAENTLLATGDKRAIRDLARSGATECIRQLQGRIVTLEALLWMLIVDANAVTVRDAFQPVLGHKTLRVVLSHHAAQDDRRCLDGVKHYFNGISADAGGLLFNPAPDELGSP